jgi:hypothetical protein
VGGSPFGIPGHGREGESGRLHRLQERLRRRELQPLARGEVDVLRSRGNGSGAELVQPRHVAECADDDETIGQHASVAQLDEHARDALVAHLELELSQVPDLTGCPLGELELGTSVEQPLFVVVPADQVFDLASACGLVDAIPVGAPGSGSLDERSRRAGQQRRHARVRSFSSAYCVRKASSCGW